MIILALDSALSSCSAAVIRDGKILSELFENRLRGQAERLIPMCQEVCAQAGLSFDDLGMITVTRGPGTFTGVRIGLAAAKGLALALGVPLIGVTTLEVVATNLAQDLGPDFAGRIAVAHDARRSEVYLQLFDLKNGTIHPASVPEAVALTDVGTHIRDGVAIMVGTGIDLVKPLLPDDILEDLDFPTGKAQPNAGRVGLIASERLATYDASDRVVPLYLRAPDAIAAQPITYPFQNL